MAENKGDISFDMTGKKRVDAVIAIVFNEGNQVLISTRPKGKSYTSYWEFVGGKIELNETKFNALKREVREELGIIIKHATPWLQKTVVYEKVILNLFFWRVYPGGWEGEVTAKENQQWEWVEIKNLTQKKLLPATYSLIDALTIPSVMFLRNQSILMDENKRITIVPYREASHNKQKIYLLYQEIEKLGKLSNFGWFAVIVENITEMKASYDAHALIWKITSQESFQELTQVLKAGQVIPIFAIDFSSEEQKVLQQLGIHGFIYRADIKQS